MPRSSWTTALAMLAVAFGSRAFAQTTGTTGTIGTTGSVGANHDALPAANNGTGSGQNTPQLSAADQQTTAEGIVTRGNQMSQRVTQMLDDARRETDVIRVTCLNDKLAQINANVRTATSRLTAMQKAVDADQRNHEFTVISVLGQKLQVLDQEANQCVGQDLYETGPTKVVTEIDTSLLPIENDPSTPPTLLPPTLPDIPPSSSSNGS